MSNLKKIVITGAPSSGKTTLVNQLKHLGYYCFPEISRHVTKQAQLQGIEQMFLHDQLEVLPAHQLIVSAKQIAQKQPC